MASRSLASCKRKVSYRMLNVECRPCRWSPGPISYDKKAIDSVGDGALVGSKKAFRKHSEH